MLRFRSKLDAWLIATMAVGALFNLDDPAETRRVYDELRQRVGGRAVPR